MRSRLSKSARFADSCASCEWRCERCRALTADVDDEMEFVAEVEGRGSEADGRERFDILDECCVILF